MPTGGTEPVQHDTPAPGGTGVTRLGRVSGALVGHGSARHGAVLSGVAPGLSWGSPRNPGTRPGADRVRRERRAFARASSRPERGPAGAAPRRRRDAYRSPADVSGQQRAICMGIAAQIGVCWPDTWRGPVMSVSRRIPPGSSYPRTRGRDQGTAAARETGRPRAGLENANVQAGPRGAPADRWVGNPSWRWRAGAQRDCLP